MTKNKKIVISHVVTIFSFFSAHKKYNNEKYPRYDANCHKSGHDFPNFYTMKIYDF